MTCDLGEYERLAQGSLGTCLDSSTATRRPCSMSNGRLGGFEISYSRLLRRLLPCCALVEPQITAKFSADTSQSFHLIKSCSRPYRCAGAPRMHSHCGGCTGRIGAVHMYDPNCSHTRTDFRDIRALIGIGRGSDRHIGWLRPRFGFAGIQVLSGSGVLSLGLQRGQTIWWLVRRGADIEMGNLRACFKPRSNLKNMAITAFSKSLHADSTAPQARKAAPHQRHSQSRVISEDEEARVLMVRV